MKLEYAVVGGGMQGGAIALDLAARRETEKVTIIDPRKGAAPAGHPRVVHLRADALKQRGRVAGALRDCDACVVALPGQVADRVIPRLLGLRVPLVDISFTPEDRGAVFDALAKKAGVPLLRDMGVAPGLSHILAAAAARELGGAQGLAIYVGGVPQKIPRTRANRGFRHAVYFHPMDLMAEYLRPARMRVGGRARAPDPLDRRETELLRDGDLGALEAFPSDGLRSLLGSYPACPTVRELTLRWPGHLDFMRGRKAEGRLDEGPPGRSPVARTAASLARSHPGARHPDFLLMEVYGSLGSRRVAFRLLDRARGGLSAMARTTGFTAAAAGHLLAARRLVTPGAHPPETLGRDRELTRLMLADLQARHVHVRRGSRLRRL